MLGYYFWLSFADLPCDLMWVEGKSPKIKKHEKYIVKFIKLLERPSGLLLNKCTSAKYKSEKQRIQTFSLILHKIKIEQTQAILFSLLSIVTSVYTGVGKKELFQWA